MMFNDQNHPFYKPRWRRLVIVATTAIWAILELMVAKDGFWTAIAVGIWAYCYWRFIWSWKDTPPQA